MAGTQKVTLVGAGLAGSLLAIYLAKRGFAVAVYERRPDPRKAGHVGGRSINLALSHRGLHALEAVGLADEARKQCIPMRGRMMHAPDGALTYVPYGRSDDFYINSISRGGLNNLLLDAAEAIPDVRLHFNHCATHLNLASGELHMVNDERKESFTIQAKPVIGTDGAGSAIRNAMLAQPGFNYSQHYLEHGYKELILPAVSGTGDARFALEKHALHIWPRGQYMLIALPNFDGSFTCTLFLAHTGDANSFRAVESPEAIQDFFTKNFADVPVHMPDYVNEFTKHPVGHMATIKCDPWHFQGTALLLGDAAHAVVPFYGQGMNCSFEDCYELDQCIRTHGDDWAAVFAAFSQSRKPNADAIADLALGNFIEMRDHTANPVFLLKRKVELLLEQRYPERFSSKYSRVTFTRAPYAEALRIGTVQDEVLMNFCNTLPSIEALDAELALSQVAAALAAQA